MCCHTYVELRRDFTTLSGGKMRYKDGQQQQQNREKSILNAWQPKNRGIPMNN